MDNSIDYTYRLEYPVYMCEHNRWIAKIILISDGRPSLREFCVNCGISNGGTKLGLALPMIADYDVPVVSYKHQGKTLGEINTEVDKEYLRWLVSHSKASDRIKKSAARVFYNEPYIPPKEGEIYSKDKIYNPKRGAELVEILKRENELNGY